MTTQKVTTASRNAGHELPPNILADVTRLKQHFPYRVVWCAERNGEWTCSANTTRRQANDHVRQGWTVYVFERKE